MQTHGEQNLYRGWEQLLHLGIAGLGIAAFLTGELAEDGPGTALYLASGADIGWLEEAHETGEGLVPAYLGLHVGAVLLHSLAGDPVWPRMFPWFARRAARSD